MHHRQWVIKEQIKLIWFQCNLKFKNSNSSSKYQFNNCRHNYSSKNRNLSKSRSSQIKSSHYNNNRTTTIHHQLLILEDRTYLILSWNSSSNNQFQHNNSYQLNNNQNNHRYFKYLLLRLLLQLHQQLFLYDQQFLIT